MLALSTMGISTFVIGALPTYQAIGFAAPLLLALCRFGQGIGLGGEWGGAVLLAVENAPPHKRALYGMFPQLGAPLGFLLSGGIFLLLSRWLTDEQFFAWGWRLPFLASAVLVLLGLYVRLSITETPVFRRRPSGRSGSTCPCLTVLTRSPGRGGGGRHGVPGDVRAVLPDDGVCAVMGHDGAALQPRRVPGHAADSAMLFFALTIPDVRRAGGARTAADDARGDGADRAVRAGAGADVRCRERRERWR